MLVGERLQLADERVELGVGDLGFVVAVVPLAVVTDLRRELVGARGDVGRDCSGDRTRAIARNLPTGCDR